MCAIRSLNSCYPLARDAKEVMALIVVVMFFLDLELVENKEKNNLLIGTFFCMHVIL